MARHFPFVHCVKLFQSFTLPELSYHQRKDKIHIHLGQWEEK